MLVLLFPFQESSLGWMVAVLNPQGADRSHSVSASGASSTHPRGHPDGEDPWCQSHLSAAPMHAPAGPEVWGGILEGGHWKQGDKSLSCPQAPPLLPTTPPNPSTLHLPPALCIPPPGSLLQTQHQAVSAWWCAVRLPVAHPCTPPETKHRAPCLSWDSWQSHHGFLPIFFNYCEPLLFFQ
jgi:hypothetical protein